MSDLLLLLIIALVCLAIGFALGNLFASTRNRADEPVSKPQNLRTETPPPAGLDHRPTPSVMPQPGATRPSLNPVDAFARALQPSATSTAASSKSIAAQIDEILQEKLASQPLQTISPEKRAIRLLELPNKGMVVMVGLVQYDGVDAVPEPEIRSLIREAVSEWEQKALRRE